MIDVKTERILSMREAAGLPFLRNDGKVRSRSSIIRWCTVGHRGIKLESVTLPTGRFTSEEAVLRFIQRLTGDQPEAPKVDVAPHDVAWRELQEAGI